MPLLRPAIKDDDNFLSKIVKYIPTEIIGVYTAIIGVLKAQSNDKLPTEKNVHACFIIFIIIILLTPVWTYLAVLDNPNIKEPPSKRKRAIFHASVATVSFFIWVYAIGDILFKCWLCNCHAPNSLECFTSKGHDKYDSKLGTVILILFSGILVPLLERIILGKPIPPLPPASLKKILTSGIDDNIQKWSVIADCKTRFAASDSAIDWVKNTGNFSTNPQIPKDFPTAMSIDDTHNLQAAFFSAVITGIICQESSFGTYFDNSGNYKGPYQLAQIVITDFNNNNPSGPVTFPDDIDDIGDLATAAKVGAWYYANNLQKLTKNSDFLNPVKDITEAQKFAIASYNGGPTLIKSARELTNETVGGERETWDNVKVNLESAGSTPDKATEIRNYVDNVSAYASKSSACWCVS